MIIWLIAEGEDLPVEENSRLMRMGALASYLSQKGHKVTWWSSTFIHGSKKYYSNKHEEIEVNKNELLVLLHSKVSYKKNISVSRIIYHRILAKEFALSSKNEDIPDIILCAWPTPQFAQEAVKYGKLHHVPVIIDARDMWPDIYERAFPDKLKPLAKIILAPLKRKASRTFASAYGLTGMIDATLYWACNYAGRKPGINDKTIFIGNEKINYSQETIDESTIWWNEKGVSSQDWIICFFSTFGSHTAIETVIRAVNELSTNYPNIKLVLGGGGDREQEYKDIAGTSKNILFAGWLDNVKMTSLMKIAKCGAFSIKNTFDFRDTFNNKAIQYISEGLPILNSLSGFAKTFIAEKEMGVTYDCDSVEDCKEKILKLFNNEEGRKKMGKNGLDCFYQVFEANVVNGQFEEYLIQMKNSYETTRSEKI